MSTAYYALFHAITARVADTIFPDTDDEFRLRVRRWIGHGDVAQVSRWIGQATGMRHGSPPDHISAVLTPPQGNGLTTGVVGVIAADFLELQERREEADYDHEAVFTRTATRSLIAQAEAAVNAVATTDGADANRYFGLIALRTSIRSR